MDRNVIHVAVTAGLSAMLATGPVPQMVAAQQLAAQQEVLQPEAAAAVDGGSTESDAATVASGVPESTGSDTLAQVGALNQGDTLKQTDTLKAADSALDSGDASEGDAVRITSLESPQSMSAIVGSAVLPGSVAATYSDGSTVEVPVSWTLDGAPVDASTVSTLGAGAYSFTGSVADCSQTVSFELTVIDEPQSAQDAAAQAQESSSESTEQQGREIQDIQAGDVTLTYEDEINIPEGIDATAYLSDYYPAIAFNDGESSVYWFNIDDTFYQGGAFDIDTSVAGSYSHTFTIPTDPSVSNYPHGYEELAGKEFTITVNVLDVEESLPSATTTLYHIGWDQQLWLDWGYTLNLSDGSQFNVSIDWNQEQLDHAEQSINTPGMYTVEGRYQYFSEQAVTATIRSLGVRSAQADTVYTEKGVAPVLPGSVRAEYDDGSVWDLPVTWDAVDPSSYAQNGEFTVSGTINGTDFRASCVVRVSNFVDIYVPTVYTTIGAAPYTSGLSVSVQYDAGWTYLYPEWEELSPEDERLSHSGEFDIKGTVEGSDREFSCHVIVVDIVDYEEELDRSTCIGTLSYPDTVTCTASNGQRFELPVEWDTSSFPFDKLQQPGVVDLHGTIVSGTLPVTLHLHIQNIKSVVGVASRYSTVEGVLPKLPQFVSVILEDGSMLDSMPSVQWQLPDPSQIVAGGSPITVTGTIPAANFEVQTEIVVTWSLPQLSPVRQSTLVGYLPVLPDTVDMVMSDGTVRSLPVQWEALNSEDFRKTGTVSISGYVTGSDVPVTAEIAVCNPVDEPIMTSELFEGQAANPPFGLREVKLDNGDVFTLDCSLVDWGELDASQLVAGNTVTLTGNLPGGQATLSAVYHVHELEGIESDAFGAEVFAGSNETVKSLLPNGVTGNSSDGAHAIVAIDWDLDQEDMFQNPGTVQISGTAGDIPVTCTVRVLRPLSVDIVDTISTLQGVLPSESGYPVEIAYTDGTDTGVMRRYIYGVTWDDPSLFSVVGTHEVTGTAYLDTVEVPVSGTVDVYTDVVDIQVDDCWTVPGSRPNVNYTAKVTLGRGDASDDTAVVDMNVGWWTDSMEYTEDMVGQTFPLQGEIYDLGENVLCNVAVHSVKSVVVPSVSTAAGVYPTLPSTAAVTVEDNTVLQVPISWNYDFTSSQFDEAGESFVVEGSAMIPDWSLGVQYPVSTVVTVQGAVEVPQEAQDSLTKLVTEVGTIPQLPAVVPVTLTDGTVVPTDVVWDMDGITAETFSEPGSEVTINGEVAGLADNPPLLSLLLRNGEEPDITATIKVLAEDSGPQISYVNPGYLTVTSVGRSLKDLLADQESYVVMSDGTTVNAKVDWDIDPSADYSQPDTYIIHGKVEGSEQLAVMYLTVVSPENTRTPESVEDLSITVKLPDEGLTVPELSEKLPVVIPVTYSNGEVETHNVHWNLSDVTADDLIPSNTLELTGTIEGVPGLTAKIKVSLIDDSDFAEAFPTSQIGRIEIETPQGVQPSLPAAVDCLMSDNTKKSLPATWGKLSDHDLSVTGTYEVQGVAEGGLPVIATVTVVPYVPVSDIDVTVDDKEMESLSLEPGATAKLDVKVLPEDATDSAVSFSSSNPNVITVDENGTVKAVSTGEATITITAGAKSTVLPVTVADPTIPTIPVTGVSILVSGEDKETLDLQKDDAVRLTARITPDNATDQSVTWSSDDIGCVTVDPNGTVHALKGGTATITATAGDKSDTLTVNVAPSVESRKLVLLNPEALKVPLSEPFDPSSLRFALKVTYDTGDSTRMELSNEQVQIAGDTSTSTVGEKSLIASVECDGTTCRLNLTLLVVDNGADPDDPVNPPAVEPNDPVVSPTDKPGDPTATPTEDPTAPSDSVDDEEQGASAEDANESIPHTGDPSLATAGLGAAGGLTALLGSWINRRRRSHR